MASRAVATKVIVPFEKADLRSGGKSFMVGQRGFEELAREVGNYGESRSAERDLKVLRADRPHPVAGSLPAARTSALP